MVDTKLFCTQAVKLILRKGYRDFPKCPTFHLFRVCWLQTLTTNVQLCLCPKHLPCSRIHLYDPCATSVELEPPLCRLSYLLRAFCIYEVVAACMRASMLLSSVHPSCATVPAEMILEPVGLKNLHMPSRSCATMLHASLASTYWSSYKCWAVFFLLMQRNKPAI